MKWSGGGTDRSEPFGTHQTASTMPLANRLKRHPGPRAKPEVSKAWPPLPAQHRWHSCHEMEQVRKTAPGRARPRLLVSIAALAFIAAAAMARDRPESSDCRQALDALQAQESKALEA